MISTWMGAWPFKCEVDAVVKNTVTSQEWRNGASDKKTPEAKKKKNIHKDVFCLY